MKYASRSRPRRGWLQNSASVALLVVLSRPPVLLAQAQPVGEYQVKAAFLFQFTRYVEWPDRAIARQDAPFLLCILGTDPFGRALDEFVRSEKAVVVLRLDSPDDARKCHLVFVAISEARNLGTILPRLRQAPVLSVGESARFAEQGGIINFYLEGGYVRFEINPAAAEASGLKISSRLLRLAKIVGSGPR